MSTEPFELDAGPRSVDECLHHFPAIRRQAADDWTRRFTGSILRQSRKSGWKPSAKQLHIMRRLVAELFAHADETEELEVFDDTAD